MGKPIGGTITLGASPVDLKTGINNISVDDPSVVHSLILRAGTANSANVYVGDVDMTSSTLAMMVLEQGDGMGFDLPAGDYVDLSNIFVLGTTNDIVYVFGLQ